MLKGLLKGIFNQAPKPLEKKRLQKNEVSLENKMLMESHSTDPEFYKKKSEELMVQARDVFDAGNIKKAIPLVEEANIYLIHSFAKTKEEQEKASRFFQIDLEGYKSAQNITLPIENITEEERNSIRHEVVWYALNGQKANYVLMAFLMFKDYEWREFEEELQRSKESSNPEKYEIYYFIKNEPKEVADLSEYKEKFYQLSLDARVLLASYNAIGRKKYLKTQEAAECFLHERGADEIMKAGYAHETDKGFVVEFPVKAAKQVMYEKKKLEDLMDHLLAVAYGEREYRSGKEQIKGRDVPNAVFLVDGVGGSTLCKAEAISVSTAKEDNLPPHSVGCKCRFNLYVRPERLSEKDKEKYGFKESSV